MTMVRKLDFSPKLYLGAGLLDYSGGINVVKLEKLKKKLSNKPLFANVFLLILSQNPQNQLEIFSARELVWSYYTKKTPYIVGIASDYREALAILEKIVQECMAARGDCCLKEYLL